jgi:hypothetical protein
VNDYLKGNDPDEEKITIQDIANRLGIGTEQLSLWSSNDPAFQ